MCHESSSTIEVVTGVEMNGHIVESNSSSTISNESISLFEKVKDAFKKYDFEVIRFYEIGYEAGIHTAGRTAPLNKEELKEIVKEIGIDYIMVDYSDVDFAWRAFYTSVMDPSADGVRID